MTTPNGNLDIAAAWSRFARQLAEWAWTRLVNRTDAWGGYVSAADRGKQLEDGSKLGSTLTRPAKKKRGIEYLTKDVLAAHFRGANEADVIGTHSTSPENTSLWGALDIDWHSEESPKPEINEAAAIGWHAGLSGFGLRPILNKSNGTGGYHLWQLFSAPLPTADVFAFCEWLVHDHAKYGLPAPPEHFPKQKAIKAGGYGNWQRIPGRHHTRQYWSEIWDGSQWLAGTAAIEFMLDHTGDDAALLPWDVIRERAKPATRTAKPQRQSASNAPGAIDRCARSYMAKLPNLSEGQGRDDVAYNLAAFLVRDLQINDTAAVDYMADWDSGNSPPKGRERLEAIIRSAHQYGRHEYGHGLNGHSNGTAQSNGSGEHTPENNTGEQPAPDAEIPKDDEEQDGADRCGAQFRHGDFAVAPGKPRRTTGGIIRVPATILEKGVPVDEIMISTSRYMRDEAVERLAAHIGDSAKANEIIEAVLRSALKELHQEAKGQQEKESLRDVLLRYVMKTFVPTHRTEQKLWLNNLGQDFTRSGFLTLVNNDMIAACAEATGTQNRYMMVGMIETELRIIFGDLLTTLPDHRPDDLPVHEAERTDLGKAIVAMWTKIAAFQKFRNATGEETTLNNSLIGLVKSQMAKPTPASERNRWRQIHPGHHAYYRMIELAEGEIADASRPLVALSMNAELANSSNVLLPKGVNFLNIKKIGKKSGIFDDLVGVTDKNTGSKKRLCVLSSRLTHYLLEDPNVSSSAETYDPATAADNTKTAPGTVPEEKPSPTSDEYHTDDDLEAADSYCA